MSKSSPNIITFRVSDRMERILSTLQKSMDIPRPKLMRSLIRHGIVSLLETRESLIEFLEKADRFWH